MRKRTRCNSLYYADEWGCCNAGALSTNRIIIPSIGSLALFPSSPDSSFLCLWASCLPCSLYVVRCAFKNKTVICSAIPKICTGVNERLGLKWQCRKLWPLRNAWLMAEQNCIWKIVVRRMQDVRCMTSINPYAEEKEDFCMFTMLLWLSKSNSV